MPVVRWKTAFLMRGDVASAAAAQVLALHPGALDPSAVHLVDAVAVVSALAP